MLVSLSIQRWEYSTYRHLNAVHFHHFTAAACGWKYAVHEHNGKQSCCSVFNIVRHKFPCYAGVLYIKIVAHVHFLLSLHNWFGSCRSENLLMSHYALRNLFGDTCNHSWLSLIFTLNLRSHWEQFKQQRKCFISGETHVWF